MKTQITLLALLLAFSYSNAQNKYCKAFGTDINEMKYFLDEHKKIDIRLESQDRIIASTGNIVFTYYFHEGQLYKTEMIKNYESVKQANDAMENFLDYFTLLQSEIIKKEDERKTKHYQALVLSDIHEALQYPTENKMIQVKFVSLSTDLSKDVMFTESDLEENQKYAILMAKN